MKLAIVGSRTFNSYRMLKDFIEKNYDINSITHIVSGGAKGADSLGERFAKDYNKEMIVFPAEWDKYGRAAGPLRNIKIIDACDECVCFWNGYSTGTKHDMKLCREKNKPLKVCRF